MVLACAVLRLPGITSEKVDVDPAERGWGSARRHTLCARAATRLLTSSAVTCQLAWMPDEQICRCSGQRVRVHGALPGQMHKPLMLLTCRGTRKTCGSLLAALDVHPRVAMQILRHSKIAVTMEICTEVPSAATRDALRKLSDWLT